MQRRQNRGHSLLRAPSDTALGRRERLKDRRMRLLHGLGHDRDRAHDSILNATAPFGGSVERPRSFAGRDAPVLALVRNKILGPRLLDDAKIFFERRAIRVIDLIVLMGQRAVNSMRLLRHDIDPSPLIAAREAGVGASSRHVIEHRDVLGHAQRILRWQHDTELSDPQPLRLHRNVQVEQDGIVRKLETLDVKMMLGETDGVVAEIVGEACLAGNIVQHLIVEMTLQSDAPFFDVGFAADRR
jgi:hypothetical protein